MKTTIYIMLACLILVSTVSAETYKIDTDIPITVTDNTLAVQIISPSGEEFIVEEPNEGLTFKPSETGVYKLFITTDFEIEQFEFKVVNDLEPVQETLLEKYVYMIDEPVIINLESADSISITCGQDVYQHLDNIIFPVTFYAKTTGNCNIEIMSENKLKVQNFTVINKTTTQNIINISTNYSINTTTNESNETVEIFTDFEKISKTKDNIRLYVEAHTNEDTVIDVRKISKTAAEEIYLTNLKNVSINKSVVRKKATGNKLYVCYNYDESQEECKQKWNLLRKIKPNNYYDQEAFSGNVAYKEELEILNVQSYPAYQGTWNVRFDTYGTADLWIRAADTTTWGIDEKLYDLRFLELKCGDETIDYEWIENSVYVKDYSCEETSIESSKVLTATEHTLEFTFGDVTRYAYNDVKDFYIQRGEAIIAAGTTQATITAGVHYTAPSQLNKSFIRLVSTRLTGIGDSTTGTTTQDPGEFMAIVSNPSNLLTSITFERGAAPAGFDTKLYYEIIEYTGVDGQNNEIIVRDEATTSISSGTSVDGSTSAANNDSRIVVFITGQRHDAASSGTTDRGLFTAEWLSGSDTPRFTRNDGTGTSSISYAIVEFTGSNWNVQRIEYDMTTDGPVTETIPDTLENTSRAFLHVQTRANSGNLDEQGVNTYISSASEITLERQGSASANQDVVAWIIENNESDGTPMIVQRGSGSRGTGFSEPDQWNESITPVANLSQTSIMGETAVSTGGGAATPRGSVGLTLYSASDVTLWRSDTGQTQTYRFEVVEWPTINPIPPFITIISPQNITYDYDKIDFNVSVDVDSVWCGFSLDGAANISMDQFNSTYYNFTQTGISDGQHNITFSCNSITGGTNTTEVLYFTVDDTPPIVTLGSPTNNSARHSNQSEGGLTLLYTVTDPYIDNCSLYYDGVFNQTKTATQGQNNFTATGNFGPHYWQINCTDTFLQSTLSENYTFYFTYWPQVITNIEDQDVGNVLGLNVSNSYGYIVFDDVNINGIFNFSSAINISNNLTDVDTQTYGGLNSSANITLYNLDFTQTPVPYTYQTYCSNCNIINYNDGEFQFRVPSFTNYSAKVNALIDTWDGTDPEGGSNLILPNSQVIFFVNYTNITNGVAIAGGGSFCNIEFADTGVSSTTYNSTSGLYEYNRSFGSDGTYDYNISCDGSSINYEPLNISDNVFITPLNTWGITTDTFTSTSTHTSVRCMGGIGPSDQLGMEITHFNYRSSGSGTLAMAIYYGGTEFEPSGAIKQAEIINEPVVAGYNKLELNTSLRWPQNQITWLCWKKNGAANSYYSTSSAEAGDFYTSHGRHDDGGSDPTTSFSNTLGTNSFGNFWYAAYVDYINNTPPTVPTNITCDGSNNCNVSTDEGVVLEGTGSTDEELNQLTYLIEANLQGLGWTNITNHAEGSGIFWNTSKIPEQTCVDFRTRSIDFEGSNSTTDYYTKNACFNITHPTYFVGATINTTELNQSDSVKIDILAKDNENITYVNITIQYPNNDLENFTLTNISQTSFYLNLSKTNQTGLYYVTKITVLDGLSNIAYNISTLSFEVIASPPSSFNLTSPPVGTESNNLIPTFVWEQTNESNFKNYTLLLEKDPGFDTPEYTFYTEQIDNTSLTVPFAIDANSNYYWMVIAYDIFNNSRNSSSTFLYITDTQPPIVSLNTPLNDSTISTTNITFNFTALDLNTLTNCTLYEDFEGSFDANETNASVVNNNTNSITINNTFEGTHLYNIQCSDLSSNTAFAQFDYVITVDLSPPLINVTAPANNTYETSSSIVSHTVNVTDLYSDVASCELIVDGSTVQSDDTITEGVPFNITNFYENGIHEWQIRCTDVHGYAVESGLYNLSVEVVDMDPPLIQLNYPDEGAFVGTNNVTFNYTPQDLTGISECSIFLDGVLNDTCLGNPGNYSNNPKAETGIIPLTGTTTSNTITLEDSYNISKAFIIRRYSMINDDSSGVPNHLTANIEWAGCSGDVCNQLTATRYSGSNEDMAASYSILQAEHIHTYPFTLNWAANERVEYFTPGTNLPADYHDKCFVNVHRTTRANSGSSSDFAEVEVRSEIIDETNVTFQRRAEADASPVAATSIGEVVCFRDNTEIQNVFVNISEGTFVTEDIPISYVDTARAWATHNHLQTDSGVGQNSIINSLPSSTILRLFVAEDGDTSPGRTPNVSVYITEFELKGNATITQYQFTPTTGNQNVTFSLTNPVNLSRTLLHCDNSMAAGGGTAHSRDYWTYEFVDDSTVRTVNSRTRSGSQATLINCWVIEWPLFTSYNPNPDPGLCEVQNNEPNYFTLFPVSEAEHNWSITCTDSSEDLNVGSSLTKNFTVDITNPVVNLTFPGNDTFILNNNATFNYTPIDENLDVCYLFTNLTGTFNFTSTDNSPVSEQNNTFNFVLPDGSYIWNVLCTDLAGLNGTAPNNYTIKIDTTAPKYYTNTSNPESPTVYVDDQLYKFNITWIDNFAVDTVMLEHDFFGSLQNFTINSINSNYTYNISDLSAGSYSFRWHANDTVNLTNNTGFIDYIISKENSSVELLLNGSNNNFSINEDTLVNITINAIVPNKGTVYQYVNDELVSTGTTPYINITSFEDPGVYVITGSYPETQNYTASNDTLYLTVNDTTAPNISLTFPDDASFIGTRELTFQYVVDDKTAIDNCTISIDGGANGTDNSITIGETSTFTKSIQDGNYTWSISCYDTSGNLGISELRNFTLIKSDFIKLNTYTQNNTIEIGTEINITSESTDVFNQPLQSDIVSAIVRGFETVGWWDVDWHRRKPLNITQNVGVNINNTVAIVNVTGLNGNISSCSNEIRIIDYQNHPAGTVLPSEIIEGDDNNWCSVRFLLNVSSGEQNESRLWAYYNNTDANPETYPFEIESEIYSDDGEGINNWINDPQGTDSGTSGWWNWSDPDPYLSSGSNAQPDNDVTANPGVNALFTGPGGDNTGTGFEGDVDGGNVSVEGPVIDLTGWSNVTLSFYRWFYTSDTGNGDACGINASTDSGATYPNTVFYFDTDEVGPDIDAYNEWTQVNFSLSDIISDFNSGFRLFGYASDTGTPTIAECGFDEFRIVGLEANITISSIDDEDVLLFGTINNTGSDGVINWHVESYNLTLDNYTVLATSTKEGFEDASDYYYFEIIPDQTPPNVTLVLPENASQFGVGDVDFNYFVSDPNLHACSLFLGTQDTFSLNESDFNPINEENNTFEDKYLTPGLYYWNVWCNDTYSNGAFATFNYAVNITYPDLFISEITFLGDTIEGSNMTVIANITNIGDTAITNFDYEVAFYNGDPDLGGTQVNGLSIINNLTVGNWTLINTSFSVTAGFNNIFVVVNINNTGNESNYENNKVNNSFFTGAYHTFYGTSTGEVILAKTESESLFGFFNITNSTGNIFIADIDNDISFTNLVSIGRNTLGNPTANDFSDIDTNINTTSFNDSVNNLWTGGTNVPLFTSSIEVYNNLINNIPMVNSTNNSNFQTGILWDSSDDSGNLQYDTTDKEDILFISEFNENKTGQFGTYDYEIKVPALLRHYKGVEDTLIFYYEIK